MRAIDSTVRELEDLIRLGQFRPMESDTIEIKPVPADGGQWTECYRSVNAFLNTRGGVLILGIREEGRGDARRYTFTGYREDAESKLKELPRQFADIRRVRADLTQQFPPPEIRRFLDGRIALVFVDELPGDAKFCFLGDRAYKRTFTGDHRLTDAEISAQEEYKQEAWNARELMPVAGVSVDDLDLDRLNEYIQQLNRVVRVETIKPSLDAAVPFLDRKGFIRGGDVTTLGLLVCGRHPGDHLGFRCQLHGYVDMPGSIALDKQDLTDNVLPLMEGGFAYVLRNIQVGVGVEAGGVERPQYPEMLLRETVNNALAHRDYSIDRQTIVAIKPGEHVQITNPGRFRSRLLIEARDHPIRVLRILPEAKPRNPRLADVLRVYRKWEGRGIGMATLVNLCLQDEVDLPYYRLRQEEVTLFLRAGRLLDTAMERLFASFDRFIAGRLDGAEPTRTQKLVLAYLYKSELANEHERHSILLTADNNHYAEIADLERARLSEKHPESPELYPVYIVARELVRRSYGAELRDLFGDALGDVSPLARDCLNAVYRHEHFSRLECPSAKQVSFFLWAQRASKDDDIRAFDAFYRRVRYTFNRLLEARMVKRAQGRSGYVLNREYLADQRRQLAIRL